MRWLARIGGLVSGFALGIVIVEVVFPNDESWPDVVPFALAAVGWLGASLLFPRAGPEASESARPQ